MKITEKVSFNIASEASYIYILSGQKLINLSRGVLPENLRRGRKLWSTSELALESN